MKAGVLLMTFGAVQSLDDVPAYYARIRGGQPATPDHVADLRRRYALIGGSSPLSGIIRRQANALQIALRGQGLDMPVEVGMRFWDPSIQDGVQRLAKQGVKRIVGITSGPYDSNVSVSGYERMLQGAIAQVDPDIELDLVRQWHDAPALDEAWKHQYQEALQAQGWDNAVHVILTSHALPERARALNDPYPRQFSEHARRLANHLNLRDWSMAYQSAGLTSEPWTGPDILTALTNLESRCKRVLVLPIGFSADHLEILHDLDHEAASHAQGLGIDFARAPSLNDSPALIQAWTGLITKRLEVHA